MATNYINLIILQLSFDKFVGGCLTKYDFCFTKNGTIQHECVCMDTLTVGCAGSPGCSLSVQAAVWMCGGPLWSVVCPTGERVLCEPPASGCSGMCWHPASLAEDHIAAPRFFSSWLTDARCLCCYGRQKKGTVSQWKLKHKMLGVYNTAPVRSWTQSAVVPEVSNMWEQH